MIQQPLDPRPVPFQLIPIKLLPIRSLITAIVDQVSCEDSQLEGGGQ